MIIEQIKFENAKKDLLYGAIWTIGGIVATAATNGHVLFWGAVLFGGYQFLKGAYGFLIYQRHASPSHNSGQYSSSFNHQSSNICHNCNK